MIKLIKTALVLPVVFLLCANCFAAQAEFTVTEPSDGAKPEYIVQAPDGYTASVNAWYAGGTKEMPDAPFAADSRFEEGKTYIAEIAVVPQDGEPLTVLINGQQAFLSGVDGDTYLYSAQFTATQRRVETANAQATVPAVVAGVALVALILYVYITKSKRRRNTFIK